MMKQVTEQKQPAILKSVAEARSATEILHYQSKTIGFCPTMGDLHAGHTSLMTKARAENDVVLTSIFVNPLQFGPDEDFNSYPRNLEADSQIAATAGVDLIFAPTVRDVFPHHQMAQVSVPDITKLWEGASRPGHFDGVTTVLSKLFNIVGPCSAYFGQKDFQQLAVVRKLVADLNIPINVVGCPTVREPDGLAMSSRNAYLSPSERAAAPVLYQALQKGAAAIAAGKRDPALVTGRMADAIDAEGRASLHYVAAVNPTTLLTPERIDQKTLLLVAAQVGKSRLIDNLEVDPNEPE